MKKLLILLVIAFGTGCHPYQTELKTSLTVLDAARDGFVAWDDQHQQAIVAAAQSLDQGKAALTDYRAKREVAIRGFEIAYKALAIAALTPTLDNVNVVIADLADLKTTVEALGAAWSSAKKGGQ